MEAAAAEGQELAGHRRGAFGRSHDMPDLREPHLRHAWGLSRNSLNPSITDIMLLTSWATPPASAPTASIFCACWSCSSARLPPPAAASAR